MIENSTLAAALDAQNSPIMILNSRMLIQWCNKTFSNSLAQKIEKYCPIKISNWRGKDFFYSCRAESAQSALNDFATDVEFSLQFGNYSFQIHASPFADNGQDFVLLTWHETTEQVNFQQQINTTLKSIEQGNISARLIEDQSQDFFQNFCRSFNQGLNSISYFVEPLAQAIDTMAECNLQIQLPSELNGDIAKLYTRFNVSLSNLTEALRQTTASSDQIGIATANIVEQNSQLSQRTDEQAKSLEVTATNINQLSSTVANTAENAKDAVQQAHQANQLAEDGRQAVNRLVDVMENMHSNSIQASEIVDIINSIAFQTNILSLNATIEAARAGIHGQSFNVVAKEVRSLSKRTAEAASQIRTLMKASEEMSQQGVLIADHASKSMTNVLEGVANANQSIEEISQAAKEQSQGIYNVKKAIDVIDDITRKNHSLVVQLGNSTVEVDRQAGYLKDASRVFTLNEYELSHPIHQQASKIAQQGAQAIAKILERGLFRNEISELHLFESDYSEILGTNPQQYHSNYDAFTDKTFPAIQEPLLLEHNFLVYAIATDSNSYVPTHNEAFAKPASGNYEQDLKYSRSKRLYKDRVGEISAQHKEAWKLQTYRRDTGELMFDMSVPIYVNQQHFGGFRVGYRIE